MLRHRRSSAFQDTLVMVMAGGRGERLYPLTRDRTKGAVPFGGQYRLIDFTLSNCVNSDLCRICVLPQYKSASLERHLRLGWSFLRPERGEGIEVLPPQQRVDEHWYRGTADAVYQNIYTLRQHAPAHTLILSSDHLYRLDYRLLLEHHLQAGAELTIACMSADLGEARHFGVIQASPDGQVIGFEEKPAQPKPMLCSPGRALVSMGIYVFDTQVLIDLLEEDAAQTQSTRDFGHDIIPRMVRERRRVQACDVAAAQGERGFYWAGYRVGGRVLGSQHGPAGRAPGFLPVPAQLAALHLAAGPATGPSRPDRTEHRGGRLAGMQRGGDRGGQGTPDHSLTRGGDRLPGRGL